MGNKKKILVIGGGFSGIISIKSLKEEGHEPVCYEKTSRPGGTWNYNEEAVPGISSIMPTTAINQSKEMGTLSDFTPDKKYPNYMKHFQLYEMFIEIGERFDCFRHITYNREVINVRRSADFDETGRWDATVKNAETGEVTDDVFDGVMVAVGHIRNPIMPEFPGLDEYRGIVMHTHGLKKVDKFRDKKVLIIGIGCSALDAAAEISNVASQVYISSRSGAWIFPRVGPYGLPFDYAFIRRYAYFVQDLMGYKVLSWYFEKFFLEQNFNPRLYNLKSSYPALAKEPSVNDFISAKIIAGTVAVRKDVKCFTETGVIFENETQVTEVDAVVMATGYTWEFSFLENGTVATENGRINLYKCIFPPQLKHPTLAIIGFLLPLGPGWPLMEMQCRWVAQVLSGNCRLPNYEAMMEHIKERYEENSKRFPPSEKMSLRVDYIPYLDELAEEIGVKPNIWKLLFTDPTLFKAIIFGPALPYQYRLEGPHKWNGARQAILTAHERVRYPLSGEYKKRTIFNHTTLVKYVIVFLLITFWLIQKEPSVIRYLVAMMLFYFTTRKRFYKKYFFSLFMLPFVVPWEGFTSAYFLIIFARILLAILTSL